jgi:hypothetical protein
MLIHYKLECIEYRKFLYNFLLFAFAKEKCLLSMMCIQFIDCSLL